MKWLNQNYDRFLVAVAAAILLGCSAFLLLSASGFSAVFANLNGTVSQDNTIPPEVQKDRDALLAQGLILAKPASLQPRVDEGNRRIPLFVSVPYISKVEKDPSNGVMKETLINPVLDSQMIHPPVPNTWLMDHKQDLLAPDVLGQDADGDGFSTQDEWDGKTDPADKDSHPPYYSKLFLRYLKRIPFRFEFDARNGNTFQINTLDIDTPTQFLKVGDLVKGTKFKVTKFEEKSGVVNGIRKDLSEVTLTSSENDDVIVLPKQQEVDSPTTYAVLSYQWTGRDFAVKKNQEFTLKPDEKVKYKCTELTETDVAIIKEDENKVIHVRMITPGK